MMIVLGLLGLSSICLMFAAVSLLIPVANAGTLFSHVGWYFVVLGALFGAGAFRARVHLRRDPGKWCFRSRLAKFLILGILALAALYFVFGVLYSPSEASLPYAYFD